MKDHAVVVTGAAGFIGNAVAARLHNEGSHVVALDDFSTGRATTVAPGVPVVACDVRDRDQIEDAVPDTVDAIVHCAAQSSGEVSFDDPWDDMTRHVHATIRLLEVAKARRVKRFLYTSSMAAYGQPTDLPARESDPLHPLSFYGAGKAATENYVRLFTGADREFVILRPFSVYGPGQDLANLRQGMISIYLAQLITTGRIVVKGSLERFRDFVHIDDAVDAFIAAVSRRECSGQTMNLCSSRPTTVKQVIDSLLEAAGLDWSVVEVAQGTPGDQFGMFGDNNLLRELGDWAPQWDATTGIRDMWRRVTAPKGEW